MNYPNKFFKENKIEGYESMRKSKTIIRKKAKLYKKNNKLGGI